jgi:hypothetical protein
MGMRSGAVYHIRAIFSRGEGVGLVHEVAEGALQGQGFGGAGAGGGQWCGCIRRAGRAGLAEDRGCRAGSEQLICTALAPPLASGASSAPLRHLR